MILTDTAVIGATDVVLPTVLFNTSITGLLKEYVIQGRYDCTY